MSIREVRILISKYPIPPIGSSISYLADPVAVQCFPVAHPGSDSIRLRINDPWLVERAGTIIEISCRKVRFIPDLAVWAGA